MSFKTLARGDKPFVVWGGRFSWQSCRGQQAWIKVGDMPPIILHPPARPSANSDPWDNSLKIDPGCNASLFMYRTGKPFADFIVRQLKFFGHIQPDADVDPTEIQLYWHYDPRRGDPYPRVSCAALGIASMEFRLDGDVIAVGIGDPPEE